MKTRLNRTIILVSAFVILILIFSGIFLYPLIAKKFSPSEKQFTSPRGTVTFNEKGGIGPQTSRDILLDESLTEADLTTDKKAQNFLKGQARETGAIFIEKDCNLSPVVAKLPNDQQIKFINEDTITHNLTIDTHSYTVKANQSFMTPNSIKSAYMLKVNCDKEGVRGYIYLHP